MTGMYVSCSTCAGKGLVPNDHDPGVPDECPDCAGGRNWLYPSLRLAKWPGGPFIGRMRREEAPR